MADAEKQITFKLLVDSESAIQGFTEASAAADNYANKLDGVFTETKAAAEGSQQNTEATTEEAEAEEKAASSTNILSDALNGLVGQLAAVLGFQQIISFLSDATDQFIAYSQAVFRVQSAAVALQQVGMDVTIQQWDQDIKNLHEEFQVFSNVDITTAIGKAMILSSQFGYTHDQIVNLTKVAMGLAETSGTDLPNAMNKLMTVIATGRTVGLAQLGLAIKTTVFEEEALREGYTQSWSSLDAMTQKQIIYNTIMDRSNILLQNSGDYTQTAAGKMRKAASDVQDATISVGATTAGVFTQIKAGWADFLKLIGPGLQALEELLIIGFAQWTQFWSDVVYVFINAQKLLTGKETIEQFEAAMRGLGDFSKKAFQDAIQGGSEFFGLIQKDLTDGTGAVESIAAGYGDALTQIEQQEEAAQTKMESDLVTFEKNVKDIYDTANKDRLNAETDYTRKMVDVETSYQRDISSIEIDYANRRYEDAVKFNENQYTKEEQFQEQMHQLREKYLYDLDDAVRARDARKVLDLNRQYNEDRLIAVQKYDEEKQLAEQQYQWELQALAREEAARIKARQVELANERADAALALKQKLSDIDTEEKYKLQKLEEGFAAEEALAAQYGDQVYKILAKYYGPGGAVDQLYAYFSTALQRLAQVSSMATAAASSLATTGYPVNYNQPWTLPGSGVAKPYAEGGTLIATHPTSAIFGDAGPEKVTFTPLSRQGADVGRVFGGGDAVGGKATVTIALTEGLKGEIIDNTLAAAAVELQQAEV